VVLRQEHKAGQKMFVDWGASNDSRLRRHDRKGVAASLFVSVLGASSYTYAEATWDQQLEWRVNAEKTQPLAGREEG
jgi:transposase